MRDWYTDELAYNRISPELQSIIDKSITDHDHSLILSILRLERHLKWRIQHEKQNHDLFDGQEKNEDNDFLRLKLYQIVKALALTLGQCKNILTHQPVANCYVIAYLKDDLQHKLIAFLAFIVQFALTYVLLMNVVHEGTGGFSRQEKMQK